MKNRQHWVLAGLGVASLLANTRHAQAEVTLAKPADGWEIYSSGRIGAFVEVLDGDGRPSPAGHTVGDGGYDIIPDVTYDPTTAAPVGQGHIAASRVRSGFLGNILAVGVRRQLDAETTLTGQLSLWGVTETDQRRTFAKDIVDEREAYIKIDNPRTGSLLVGRALSLFSRGATEIDFLYGHGYGVGSPQGFDGSGPSGGHIGYGVLASVFVAGVAYATPSFYGLQLTAGYYDPAQLNNAYWTRNKYGRPEAEATYDVSFGANAKVHVFANGAYQKVYSESAADSSSVYGAGAGFRLEAGPFHIGVAAHKGRGLGVNYFMNVSDAMLNQTAPGAPLRDFDGGYVQTQTVVGKFDFNVGAGITRVYQVPPDTIPDPMSTTNQPGKSFLKSQMGISGVVVYHFTPNLHGALDYFRSDVRWWLGDKQILHSFNGGLTVTW